jgi:hypothetical protein
MVTRAPRYGKGRKSKPRATYKVCFMKAPLTHSNALAHHFALSPQGGEGATIHAALAAPAFFAAHYAAAGNE